MYCQLSCAAAAYAGAPKRDAAVKPSDRWQLGARGGLVAPTFQPSRDLNLPSPTWFDRLAIARQAISAEPGHRRGPVTGRLQPGFAIPDGHGLGFGGPGQSFSFICKSEGKTKSLPGSCQAGSQSLSQVSDNTRNSCFPSIALSTMTNMLATAFGVLPPHSAAGSPQSTCEPCQR